MALKKFIYEDPTGGGDDIALVMPELWNAPANLTLTVPRSEEDGGGNDFPTFELSEETPVDAGEDIGASDVWRLS